MKKYHLLYQLLFVLSPFYYLIADTSSPDPIELFRAGDFSKAKKFWENHLTSATSFEKKILLSYNIGCALLEEEKWEKAHHVFQTLSSPKTDIPIQNYVKMNLALSAYKQAHHFFNHSPLSIKKQNDITLSLSNALQEIDSLYFAKRFCLPKVAINNHIDFHKHLKLLKINIKQELLSSQNHYHNSYHALEHLLKLRHIIHYFFTINLQLNKISNSSLLVQHIHYLLTKVQLFNKHYTAFLQKNSNMDLQDPFSKLYENFKKGTSQIEVLMHHKSLNHFTTCKEIIDHMLRTWVPLLPKTTLFTILFQKYKKIFTTNNLLLSSYPLEEILCLEKMLGKAVSSHHYQMLKQCETSLKANDSTEALLFLQQAFFSLSQFVIQPPGKSEIKSIKNQLKQIKEHQNHVITLSQLGKYHISENNIAKILSLEQKKLFSYIPDLQQKVVSQQRQDYKLHNVHPQWKKFFYLLEQGITRAKKAYQNLTMYDVPYLKTFFLQQQSLHFFQKAYNLIDHILSSKSSSSTNPTKNKNNSFHFLQNHVDANSPLKKKEIYYSDQTEW